PNGWANCAIKVSLVYQDFFITLVFNLTGTHPRHSGESRNPVQHFRQWFHTNPASRDCCFRSVPTSIHVANSSKLFHVQLPIPWFRGVRTIPTDGRCSAW